MLFVLLVVSVLGGVFALTTCDGSALHAGSEQRGSAGGGGSSERARAGHPVSCGTRL